MSLALRDQRVRKNPFASGNITIRWVQSAGSNKAPRFRNAGSPDLGSKAGAAAVIGKVNGDPIRTIYVLSRPEWTALVTMPDGPIRTVADLRGRRIAGGEPQAAHTGHRAAIGRTDRSNGTFGEAQALTTSEDGNASQAAGVLGPAVDATAVTLGMIDGCQARAIGS